MATNPEKYRRRRAPTSLLQQQMPPGNTDGRRDRNVIYGEAAGQLLITTVTYLVDAFRVNERIRQQEQERFVKKFQHLLPVQDTSASLEGKVLSLLVILGFTNVWDEAVPASAPVSAPLTKSGAPAARGMLQKAPG